MSTCCSVPLLLSFWLSNTQDVPLAHRIRFQKALQFWGHVLLFAFIPVKGTPYHLTASGNFLPKLQHNGMSYWRCGCSFHGFLNKELCNWKSWPLLALGLKILQAEHLTEICPPLRQQTWRGIIEVEGWNLEEVQEKIMFEEAGAKAFKTPHRHQVPHSQKQQRETEMAVGKLGMYPCAGHRGRLYSTLYWYCKRGKKDLQF